MQNTLSAYLRTIDPVLMAWICLYKHNFQFVILDLTYLIIRLLYLYVNSAINKNDQLINEKLQCYVNEYIFSKATSILIYCAFGTTVLKCTLPDSHVFNFRELFKTFFLILYLNGYFSIYLSQSTNDTDKFHYCAPCQHNEKERHSVANYNRCSLLHSAENFIFFILCRNVYRAMKFASINRRLL